MLLSCAGPALAIQSGSSHRGRGPSIEDHAPAGRIAQENHTRRQRNLDSDRRVFGDPARSCHAIVEAIVNEEWVVRVFDQTGHGLLGRECASLLAVARAAGAAIAAERLHIEEFSTRLKPPSRALLRQAGIAIQRRGLLEEV